MFAQRFVDERMRLRPMGRSLLMRDLKRRGIPPDIIDEVLEEALAEVDAGTVAYELLRGRAARYRNVPREKALSRMFGFLGRRGFAAGIAREAAQRVWSEIGDASEDDASGENW
jgi:regulatory protein